MSAQISDEKLRAAVDILLSMLSGQRSQQQAFEALYDVGVREDEMDLVLDLAKSIVEADQRKTNLHDMDAIDVAVVCERCGELLHRFGADDETWIHSQGWKHSDHDAVPIQIPRSEVKTERCDFCGVAGKARWVFTGSNIKAAAIGHDDRVKRMDDMGKRWAACEVCGPLVRANRINDLMRRHEQVSDIWQTVHMKESREYREMLRENMRQMWGTFIPTIVDETYIEPPREPAKLNARMMPKLQQGLARYWAHEHILREMAANRRDRGMPFHLPGVHCGNEDAFKVNFDPTTPDAEKQYRNFSEHLIAGIWASDLYWVSAKFTQLAIMAGRDFEKLSLTREELPAPFGFIMFEEPIGGIERPGGTAAIRGITWTLIPQGIWLNLYIQGEDKDHDVDVDVMRHEIGYLMCPNNGSGFQFGASLDIIGMPADFEFIRTIFATWALMVQPGVAEHTTAPVDKKYARAYQRSNGRKLPDVRLVDLRRQPQRSAPTGEHEGQKLRFRVYRRGHWKRQQYGPGRALRKTIYVNAYIAGPQDAPLRDKPPTVKVLR